jgi:ArsR family transcriptional regulator
MNDIETLTGIFKALSDPTRLRLVKLLNDQDNALCVNALSERLGVTQSAVSQHLRVLKQAGLVTSERRGYHVHYEIDRTRLSQYKALLVNALGKDFL